jgi:hypothetical protein
MSKYNIKTVEVSTLKGKEDNPRFISQDKYKKLVRSIKEFPEMLEIRPLVIDENNIVLGGNMRLKAIKELKINKVPVILASELTEKQKEEFLIKDNLNYGEWDFDVLTSEWNVGELIEWGVDLEINKRVDELKEEETIHVEKSLQIIPKKEYVIIMADEDSEEWEELKSIFKCGIVRQGGCKVGSTSDKATTGLERVFDLKTFKERVLNGI